MNRERRPSRKGVMASSGVHLEWPGRPAHGAAAPDASGPAPDHFWIGEGQRRLVLHGRAEEALARFRQASKAASSFVGQVSLCYMDPPFNTGEHFVHYNDGVSRSDWLTMMHASLLEASRYLSPYGSLWLHLNDNEQHHGRVLLDEVFGADKFVATVVWQRRTSRDNRKAFDMAHDYIHVYSPAGPKEWKKLRNPLPDMGAFSNPDDDPRGPWRSTPLTVQDGHATSSQFYTIVTPTGNRHNPPAGRCWIYSAEKFQALVEEGRIYWPRKGAGKPRLKKYAHESTGLAPSSLWSAEGVGDNAEAKRELRAQFPGIVTFDTPKPERLMERIITISTQPGQIVMDPFAGSGTTAAVASRLGRDWLTVEADARVLESFTLPRVRARK